MDARSTPPTIEPSLDELRGLAQKFWRRAVSEPSRNKRRAYAICAQVFGELANRAEHASGAP
jgi:hypothetical protein